MARHLIMGYYTCNLGHNHSTDDEMKECNRIEEEKHMREHSLAKENIDNEKVVAAIEMQKREIEHEKEKMKHKERLAELELEKVKAEKEKQPPKSRVCVLS